MSHVTWTPLSRSKVKVTGAAAYCGGLLHSLLDPGKSLMMMLTDQVSWKKFHSEI